MKKTVVFFLGLLQIVSSSGSPSLNGSSLHVITKDANSYSLKEANFINPTTTLNTSEIDVSNTSKLTNAIDQRSRKVLFPKSEDLVVLGSNTVLIIMQDKGVEVFNLAEFYCYHPTTLICSVDQESPRVYIGCQYFSVVIAIYVKNGEYKMETVAYDGNGLVSPAFVIHNGQIQAIQLISGRLLRVNLRESIAPHFLINSNVVTSFGECTTTWHLLTYNSTHFIIECKGTKRYLVKGDGEDYQIISSSGHLWILKELDMAVDLTATHFTFYQNGFLSNCSVALSSPVTRVDYAIIDGKVILVLLGPSIVMVYDTTKGCSDEYLEVLANGTFPCFSTSGSCDGYHIFDNQYILIVSIVSGLYHISTHNLKSVALLEHHFNFFNVPLVLYVITPSPVEDGSGFITDTTTTSTSTTSLATSPVTSNVIIMTQSSTEVPYTTFSEGISISLIPTVISSVTSPISSSIPTLATISSSTPTLATNVFRLNVVTFGIAATAGIVIVFIFCCVLMTIILVIILVRKRKKSKGRTYNFELQLHTPPQDNQGELASSSIPSSPRSSQADIQGNTTTTYESPNINVDCFDLPPGQQEIANGPDRPGFGVDPSSNPYTDRPNDKTTSTTTYFDIVRTGGTTLDDRIRHVTTLEVIRVCQYDT